MSNLPPSSVPDKQQALLKGICPSWQQDYFKLTNGQRKFILGVLYNTLQFSYPQIAELLGTYPNKVRRDAGKLGIISRTKRTAQQIALKHGRHTHPTKGKKRPENVKVQISERMNEVWAEMSEAEKQRRSNLAKQQWDKMTEEDKQKLRQAAGDAVRQAAKDGSKLEKFLLKGLLQAGFRVDFHREHFVQNERLQVDLFMPQNNIAIEVDGPSHSLPIWGQESLEKTRKTDAHKTSLLLSKGLVLIRIQQIKPPSQKYKRDILQQLIETIKRVTKHFPSRKNRYITLS